MDVVSRRPDPGEAMKKAFTLIGLLIVVAILLIISGMLFPVIFGHKLPQPEKAETVEIKPTARFITSNEGTISRTFGDSRGVFLINDTLTKRQYLAVENCGLIELQSQVDSIRGNKITEWGERP
jgi:hypothetical protein